MQAFVAAMLLATYAGSIAFFFVVCANRIHADGQKPSEIREDDG